MCCHWLVSKLFSQAWLSKGCKLMKNWLQAYFAFEPQHKKISLGPTEQSFLGYGSSKYSKSPCVF